MTGQTQPPSYPPDYLAYYQPVRVRRQRKSPLSCSFSGCGSCLAAALIALFVLIGLLAVYLLAPLRTDLLVLGIDRVPDGTTLGRSDTIILVTVNPLKPTVKMLSIPRDLWVNIPGVGENRINTAHFFAESSQPGSGSLAALRTVNENFGLAVKYYVRLRFDAFQNIVNALGGVTVNLPEDMGGLTAGQHHLDGTQALAFVRDRKGTDDFFRMEQAQFLVRATAIQLLSPLSWPRLPLVAGAALSSVDTNLPFWHWPRIGLAFLRAAVSDSLDSRTIRREMTTPYITDGGANVLLPNWELILPYVQEIFQ
jgi:polyisoprenyl-teichoic acid--peptidoglycan teichoic acid transferase